METDNVRKWHSFLVFRVLTCSEYLSWEYCPEYQVTVLRILWNAGGAAAQKSRIKLSEHKESQWQKTQEFTSKGESKVKEDPAVTCVFFHTQVRAQTHTHTD